jgi:hypothetical protein
MRLVIVLIVSMFGSIVSVMAKPYVLTCTVEGYGYLAKLTVDLDKKEMKWNQGGPEWEYLMTSVTEEYITGSNYNDDDPAVGAEVIVLNRVSGEYKRAKVGLYCEYPPPNCHGNTVLRAFTITGQCVRPIL